jgi:hypothetical protein
MRKITIPIVVIIVFAVGFLLLKSVDSSLFDKQKENFTFVGMLQATSYETMPNVPLVEIYHDGESVVLAKVEKIEAGSSPYPTGSQIVLVVKDYSQFPNLGSREKKYRITLTKFVERGGFEYWRCRSKEI